MEINPTIKQANAWELLLDESTKYIAYGGAAGCFTGDTLVLTTNGYVPIQDITNEMSVFALDEETKTIKPAQVVTTYKYGGSQKMIRLFFHNGQTITATENHEFYFKGNWVPIKIIANEVKNVTDGFNKLVLDIDDIKTQAREIDITQIERIEFFESDNYVYDIEVKDYENYIISESNIIVHNSGKSWLICEWLITQCLAHPGSKWFIGRDELKKIMSSTYQTFIKVCSFHNIDRSLWKLNGQYNYIEFTNGSRIDLLDLKLLPTDPLFERFGSMEFTGGAIEEAGEVHANAFEILKSRIGRHMSDTCRPKILITCNPKKNWVYYDFYLPWKENRLPKDHAFIPAYYKDNPYTAEVYGEQLAGLKDKVQQQRLMHGNWEYDDDENAILTYGEIMSVFNNEGKTGGRYMTVDPAFLGKDEAVIMIWDGYVVEKIITIAKTDHETLLQLIDMYANMFNVSRRNIVADAVGEGAYIPNLMKGVRGFIGGSSALGDKEHYLDELKKPFYANLRSQCIYEMAQKIKTGEVLVKTDDEAIKTKLVQELEQWKLKAVDDDKRVAIIGKDEVKANIGRSPDVSDAFYMRIFFDLEGIKPVSSETVRRQLQANKQNFNKWAV